jgi:hypothetical protein
MLTTLLLTSSLVLAAAPGAEVDAGAPALLEGTWELDVKASSPLTPLLDYLEVGGLVRMMAPGVVSTQILKLSPEQLELTVKAGWSRRTTVMPLDGKTPFVDELFDHRLELTSTLVEGTVVSTGTIAVKGGTAPMKVRRFLEGDRMVQLTTIDRPGAEALTVRRVFTRK